LIEKNLDSKIRVRNYRLNSGDRYYYYRIGALDFMPETGDMGEMEIKIKEKFLTRENF